jgi:hypothetical protein
MGADGHVNTPEQWREGDVVLDADGLIWERGDPKDIIAGRAWLLIGFDMGYQVASDDEPMRPLTLLVRDGKPYPTVPGGCCTGERWGLGATEGHGELMLGHTANCPISPGVFEEIELP